jgi:hypothetical protein
MVYAGGVFSRVGGQERKGVVAIDLSGGILTWKPGMVGFGAFALAASNQTLHVGGHFSELGGAQRANFGSVPIPNANDD